MSLSYSYILARSAQLLEKQAQCIRAKYEVQGEWKVACLSDGIARCEHDEMLELVRKLRCAATFNSENPYGGPAAKFMAIACALRSGANAEEVMTRYGVAYIPDQIEEHRVVA